VRNRIGTATARILPDRLPVRQVYDQQQHDDDRADRTNVAGARRAERDEQRHRRFGAVRRRAERIESEHRDARDWADALLALFLREQRPAEEDVPE
jgi:hypothetical protein